jgi:hypothetical protein
MDERLPEEYEKCLVGLTAILREAGSCPYNNFRFDIENGIYAKLFFIRSPFDFNYRFLEN